MLQGLFIAFVVLSYLALFAPTIRALNIVLKDARGTLLLLPDDIVANQPSIRNLMKEYARIAK